jgi:hypothetical protein
MALACISFASFSLLSSCVPLFSRCAGEIHLFTQNIDFLVAEQNAGSLRDIAQIASVVLVSLLPQPQSRENRGVLAFRD